MLTRSLRPSLLAPARQLDAELLRVFGRQALPAVELHGVGAHDAADRLSGEKPLHHVEAQMPARGAPSNEALVDVVPQREPGSGSLGLEFPAKVAAAPAELEQPRRLGPGNARLRNHRRRRA